MCFVKKKLIRLLKRIVLVMNKFCWISLFILVIIILVWMKKSPKYDKDIMFKKPVLMWWTGEFGLKTETKYCPGDIVCEVVLNLNASSLKKYNANAYLYYGSHLLIHKLPLPRQPGDVWALFHEESPRNRVELMHESMLHLFNFSATFSRFSDVPFPLQHIKSLDDITSKKYYIETSIKNVYLKEIAPIMYLQSDCETATERDDYVKELMKFIQIDSYGACLKNKNLPDFFSEEYLDKLYDDTLLKFFAKYKFVIAFENGVCDDYVTEKFWRPISIGSVPIYFGSPTIRDWLPNNKSAILRTDFSTPESLSEHIKLLLKNDSLYEEYLDHKTKMIVTNEMLIGELKKNSYQTDMIETLDKFECFVCKKLHDRLNGDKTVHVVTKSHYNCPKPVTALTLQENPLSYWLQEWMDTKEVAEHIYKIVCGF